MPCAGLTTGATGSGYCGGPRKMTVYQATTGSAVVGNVVNLVTSAAAVPTATSTAVPSTTIIPAADDDEYELFCTRVKKSTLRRRSQE